MPLNKLNLKKEDFWAKFVVFLAIVIYFAFGSYNLSRFITVDEHYWINERIIQYWHSVKKQDWKMTYINDKPGITLAYVSGIGLFWEPHPDLYIKKLEKHISLHNMEDTLRLNLIFRLPLLIFNGLFSLFLFWLVKKVTENDWIATFTASFILLSPILLGISRIVNPDSLLWNFSFASILSFFLYLKNGQKKFALLTAFLLGLLLLTKYTSVILFPFFFLLIILFFIFNPEKLALEKKVSNTLVKFSLSYVLICIGAFSILSILMPSILIGYNYFNIESVASVYSRLWQIFAAILVFIAVTIIDGLFFKNFLLKLLFKYLPKIKRAVEIITYTLLTSTVSFILINWMTGQSLINFDNVPFDIKRDLPFIALPFYQKFIIELYPIIFSLSPIVLIFLLYIWIKSIFKKTKHGFLIFSLSSFIVIYIISLIANNLLGTIRYSIMVYPILMFLAAVGLWEFYENYKNKGVRLLHLILIVVISSVFSLWQIKPFYFDYTNSLLPKQYLITSSWGEGGYEAAKYLNSLPNAEKMTIWSDYSGVCEFFKGTCIKVYQMEKTQFKIDYYVLTRRGEINYQPSRPRWRKPGFGFVEAYKYYEKNNPVWSLYIDDRPANFIKIFKAE